MRCLNWEKISSNRVEDYRNQLCNGKSSGNPGDITVPLLLGHLIAWFLRDIHDRLMAEQKRMFQKVGASFSNQHKNGTLLRDVDELTSQFVRFDRAGEQWEMMKPDSLQPNAVCTQLAIRCDPGPVWFLLYCAPCSVTATVEYYDIYTGWLHDAHN